MTHQEKIMHFFKEISAIPRSSGDEKQVSEYILTFARDRGLWVYQDNLYNIIIKKPATIKDCTVPGVILQGHMDMVYVKSQHSNKEYTDGIEVLEKDGIIYAGDTTLGADNGIAVAYFLTLLDSDDILHPDIEAVITTQEEVGLIGAKNLSYGKLSGKYMINLDAENEGVFVTSCAGGVRCSFDVAISYVNAVKGETLEVLLDELQGGHSGLDINIGRGNAIKMMSRLLCDIDDDNLQLSEIICDGKANAIANSCTAKIVVPKNTVEDIKLKIIKIKDILAAEIKGTDRVEITITEKSEAIKVLDKSSKRRILAALTLMPCGVQGKSFAIENLTETSINIGAITQADDKISVLTSIRSNVASRKHEIKQRLDILAELVGATTSFFSDYPQWEYNPSSQLKNIVGEIYSNTFNKEPVFSAIHAGLECGYFSEQFKDLDIISFGADIFDVHTIKERANVQSIYNVFGLLVEVLKKLS